MTQTELLIMFFTFVATLVAAAGYVFVVRPARAMAPEIPADIALDGDELPGAKAAFAGAFRRIGEALPGRKNDQTRQLLMAAGYRWPSAVSIFQGIRIGACLMLGAAGAWAAIVVGEVGPEGMILPAICGIGFGYLLPDRVLERLASARSARLRRALPSALDLILLSVESGQGLDAAILDASRSLRTTHPDLATEFTQLHLELRANTSREDALRNLGERTRDLELKKFSGLLIDTDRFGSSLGPALRTHAKYLRTRLRQSAQERARKVAVKLVFPVFFLIFPSVVLVTLGPAVILIFTQMQNLIGL